MVRDSPHSMPTEGRVTPPSDQEAPPPQAQQRNPQVDISQLHPSEWKVINGRLLHKARSVPHERSVSARYDAEAHGILPRFANQPRSPTVRRKLDIADKQQLSSGKLSPLPSQTCASPVRVRPSHLIAEHVQRMAKVPEPGFHAALVSSDNNQSCTPRRAAVEWGTDQAPDQLNFLVPHPPLSTSSFVLRHDHARALPPPSLEAEQRVLARPSNRSEAVQLADNIDRQLKEHRHDYRAIERSWKITFCEIVRQVYVHCAERGVLLDRVRRWYDIELQRVSALARDATERERRLRGTLRADDGSSMAELLAELDNNDETLAMGSKRLELMQLLVKKTGARAMGKLVIEGTRDLGLSMQHEMLNELLPQLMPLPTETALTIFSSAADAGPETLRVLMERLFDSLSVSPQLRAEMLVQTFAACEGGLDEAESALADVMYTATRMHGEMSGMEGGRRATRLMGKLVGSMAETSRGAAVGAILAGQTTAQKVTALGDALDNLEERDTPAVLKELVEHLLPADRLATLLPLLSDLPAEEKAAILGPLLAGLKPEEFTASLAARAQQENMLSAMPPPMLTSLLSELPQAVDGARLAAILPEGPLQQWGSNMMAAAPESTCKAWLTQLLKTLSTNSTYSSLSQLLVSALSPEYFAYAYANLGMDERLHMLRSIHELKQLGVVSPAPWSKQEVSLLTELLDLRSASDSQQSSTAASPFGSPQAGAYVERRRRGSVVGALPTMGSERAQPRKEKAQLIPLDQMSRTIADIYQKKVKDDQLADSKGKLRCSMVRFVRNYLLRQYGMKSMAEKALHELTATVRAYSQGGASSLVRVRMFAEMTGMLKDAQAVARPPWVDRKTDFFLFLLLRLVKSFKDEAAGGGTQQSGEHAPPTRARRQSVAPGHKITMPVDAKASVKEVLCREEVIISSSAVQAVLELACPDAAVCAHLVSWLQSVSSEESDDRAAVPPGMLHMDDVLEVAIAVWDEQEEKLAPQVEQMLQDTFKKADTEGNGRMSFHAFEKFCASCLQAHLDEDQVLDLFDEAIRVTEELSGEETDTVMPEGFARVVREHNLLSLQNMSSMVDAVAIGRQENGRKSSVNNERQEGSGAPGSRDGHRASFTGAELLQRQQKGRRTVIRTASSKANERAGGKERSGSISTQKPESVYRVIRTAVQTHFLFRHLDAAMHREIVQRMVACPVSPGQDVIKQGDKGDYFYVAERGVFDVLVGDEKVHTYTADPDQGKHPCFGELALLYAKPRAATIRAAEVGMLWGLDRRGFRSVQMFSSGVDLAKLLRRMDVFSSLPFNSLQTLMNHMLERNFKQGDYVFKEGEEGDTMYVIMQGSANVSREGPADESDDKAEVTALEEEMYFGERALLDNELRKFSVRAQTSLKCMAIDRATFERLLGPLQQIIDSARQTRERAAASQKMQLEAAGLSGVSVSSFKLEAPIVRLETGGYMAATHKDSGEVYTLRAESKLKLFETEQAERVSRELEVMRLTGGHGHLPMLPAMLCTFASPVALFSLFKTRIACELSYLTEQTRFAPDTVRYVSACVVLALERLHCGMGVVSRSLSPDMLSVDENGCVCLMDFRQSKLLAGDDNKTFTLCGVADYLSPEQVTCSGHGLPVDFWGMGVLLWEIAAGEGPWGNDPNEVNIYRRITDHTTGALRASLQAQRENGFLPPDVFVPTLVDLIDQLLVPDPLGRLGAAEDEASAPSGFAKLKGHAWFNSIGWDQLVEGNVPSPILSNASTHVREQLEMHSHRTDDALLSEVAGTTEFSGDRSWFAQY